MIYKLLLLFCLYIPFQIALNPASGIDLASGRVFVLVLALLWLMYGLKNRRICVPARIQTFLILSFLFLAGFSIFWERNLDWGGRKLLFLLSIFPIYFIAADILRDKEKAVKVIKFLIWSAAIAAAIGIIQFLLQFAIGIDSTAALWRNYVAPVFLGQSFSRTVLEYPSWLVNLGGQTVFRAISTFPDPHMFSFYLGMALPLSGAMYYILKKRIYLLFSFIILLADLLTFSRGGYVGLAAGLLFFLMIIIAKKSIDPKKILVGITVGVIFLVFFIMSPVGGRFLTSFNASEGSNQGRLEIWKEAVAVIEKNPCGVGLGNYSLTIDPTANYREPIYAHNLYLDIAAETGIINAIIWILLMFFSIRAFLRQKDNLHTAGAISLIIFSAHSVFETALFSVQVLPFLIILIALSTVKTDEK